MQKYPVQIDDDAHHTESKSSEGGPNPGLISIRVERTASTLLNVGRIDTTPTGAGANTGSCPAVLATKAHIRMGTDKLI
jgi:hypothetical protein